MIVDVKKLLSPNKFLPIYLSRRKQKWQTLGPVAVELHWTSNCNYNCIHCSYGKRRANGKRLGNQVILTTIHDLIKLNTRAVYLSGGGEPTTVEGWDKYAQQLIDNKIEVALITNGIVINKKNLNVIRKMNYIAVSVYSVDEGDYKNITRGNFFQRQFSLPSIIKTKASKVIVGARCVLNNINYRNIVEIYQQAIIAGFDYIIFIPALDYEEQNIALNEYAVQEVKKLIRKNYKIFNFAKTNIDRLILRNVNHYEQCDYRRNFSKCSTVCMAIQLRTNAFINYDGEVYLCQPHIGSVEYSIGNVNVSRFSVIWNSVRHFLIIDKLNQEFGAGLCKNCRAISFNEIINDYINKTLIEDLPIIDDSFV